MGGPKTAIFTQVVYFYPGAVGHITVGGNKFENCAAILAEVLTLDESVM